MPPILQKLFLQYFPKKYFLSTQSPKSKYSSYIFKFFYNILILRAKNISLIYQQPYLKMYNVEKCRFISKMVKQTLNEFIMKTFPGAKGQILLQSGPKNECEYVSASAMKGFNMNKEKGTGTAFGCKTVEEYAQKIVDSFHENEVIGSLICKEKGFIQIKVKDSLIESQINSMMSGLEYPEVEKQKIVVDFSSPNIAKEMHVGHLRSTILGQSVCRVLEFMGHQVVRANHVGDWGTQFGMLIAYMQEAFPDYAQKTPEIKDLDLYYKSARQKFDSDPQFKRISQETVVKLQAYEQTCFKAWQSLCSASRDYFNHIYQRLGVEIDEFGQSYYNPFIPAMLKELQEKGMIKEDSTKTEKNEKKSKKKEKKKDEKKEEKVQQKEEKQVELKKEVQEVKEEKQQKKAKCIFIQKFEAPLIVVKSDGGYNYDTTDMACIQYRLMTLKVNRIIYITDSGQKDHFEKVFIAAKKAGWLVNQRVDHMGFGLVLGEDRKKFSTRKGKTVKLLDLISECKENALAQLKSRQKDEGAQKEEKEKEQTFTSLKPEQFDLAADKIGIAGIKYYDLKQNRTSDYVFDLDKMLDPRGNTAVYLIYAYVRMCSIIRKSGMTSEEIQKMAKENPFVITHPDERILAGMLIKFYDVLNDSVEEMAINKITDYIYEIAVKVQENYKKYRIIGDENMKSRIVLCECIRKTLEKAFFMVGIVPVEKI